MSVRRAITEKDGIYFITITNCNWLPLFERSNGYDAVYKWFDHLKSKSHHIVGYVIMPNHLHCIIAFSNIQSKSINTIIGNGKRFMAYDIVNRLRQMNEHKLLQELAQFVNATDKSRGKQHEVFESSFDAKPCYSDEIIEQKLNYIHENPCMGKWNLAESAIDYKHSSAKYYLIGEHSYYEVRSYRELADIDLTKKYDQGL